MRQLCSDRRIQYGAYEARSHLPHSLENHFGEAQMEAVYRMTCRSCGSKELIPLFSLGNLCLCNTFIESPAEEIRMPLELVFCDAKAGCGLVQLRHTTPPELMYTKYWYKSAISTSMRVHLSSLINKAEDIVDLKSGDLVLDIGCNDGTALRSYKTQKITTVGFEPNDLYKEAEVGTTKIINDFFNAETFQSEFGEAKAKIITTIAMFYDLEDPNKFVADIANCLDKYGLWVIEMHYLGSMIEMNGFDAIVHEHLEYYSLQSLQNLLKRHAMEPFDVEQNDMNGGSFRIYVRHQGAKLQGDLAAERRLREFQERERALGLDQLRTYEMFYSRVKRLKRACREFLEREKQHGRTVYVYGASTKANAVLQFFGLDQTLVTAAADKNPDKWGRTTPGSRIPIISPEQATKNKPDYLLVLIWHLVGEVKAQWMDYIASGGKLIIPFPKIEIYPAAKVLTDPYMTVPA